MRMISIEAHRASIGRFYNRLRHFVNAQNVISFVILLFLLFLLYLSIPLHVLFALFMLVAIDVAYVNSVRFKHIYFS